MKIQNKIENNFKGDDFEENNANLDNIDFFYIKYIFAILRRRKRIVFFSSLLSFLFIVFYTGYKSIFDSLYIGSFEMLISDPVAKKRDSITDLGSKPDAVFDYVARSVDTLSNDIPTIIEYLKSEKVLTQLDKKYQIKYTNIFDNLSVDIVDNSKKDFDQPPNVLKVSLRAKDPSNGLKTLKAISEVFLESSLRLRQERLSEGLEFLDSQEPILKSNTEKLRLKLAIFREENNLVNPENDANTLVEKVEIINDKIAKLNSEKDRLEIIKKEIKNGNLISLGFQSKENEGSLSGGAGLIVRASNQNLLKELFEIKNLYAKYLTTYKPNSEMVLSLEKKINYLEPIVLKQQLGLVNSALELKKGLISNAKKQKANLNKSFLKKPKIIANFNSIKKKLELAIEKERALVKARENFQLEITQQSLPWQIIKKPNFNSLPISPNIFNYLLFGFLGSLSLGTLIALVRDLRENIFHEPELVSDFFETKILTNIPFLENISEENISLNQKVDSIFNENLSNQIDKDDFYKLFYYKESLRNLYTSIITDSLNKKLKIITTCSTIFGEGKTLLNSLISKIFADNNLNVLLIDADLRKPSIHENFLIKNKLGLSNLLSDEKLNLEKYLKAITPNLSVITAGTQNSNPTKILSSPAMDDFIKYLRESNKFDLIIFDNPPSLGLSDYKLISRNTDGIIFLVSLGYVKRVFAKKSYDEIKDLNLNIIGIITNSINKLYSNDWQNPIYQYYGNYNNYEKRSNIDNSVSITNAEGENSLKNKILLKILKLVKSLKLFLKWLDK